jgi:hypothetical protein
MRHGLFNALNMVNIHMPLGVISKVMKGYGVKFVGLKA